MVGALALCPTGNAQGGFLVLELVNWSGVEPTLCDGASHARPCRGPGSSYGTATESKSRATVQESQHELSQ